jgi:hypothetical protein
MLAAMGESRHLVRIGSWRGDEASDWPDPAAFIDPQWESSEREMVRDHLRGGFVVRAYLGKSTCRLCGEPIGSLELSDGTFIWPEGLVHYLDEHHVRLPHRFAEHVRSQIEQLEGAVVEEDWWRSQRSAG